MRESDKTYKNERFIGQQLSENGYEYCEFIECDFSLADLADITFMECSFSLCNFAQGKLDAVAFKDVRFQECNFLGVDMSVCSPFLLKMHFIECQMDLTLFNGMKLKGSSFSSCSLKEADFSNADLTEIDLEHCQLERAIFQNTNLIKTDFRTAIDYSLDPSQNTLKKTRFSKDGVMGLLSKHDIKID